MKRLLTVGLVLLLLGGTGWVVYAALVGKKCPFTCRKDSRVVAIPAAKKDCCEPGKEVAAPRVAPISETEKKIDYACTNISLEEALNHLAAEGANVVYSAPSLKELYVTVKLTQVPVSAAVVAVLKAAGVKYEVNDQVIVVVGR